MSKSIEIYQAALFTAIRKTEVYTDGTRCNISTGVQYFGEHLERLRADKGTAYIIGNGASASMASHLATDLTKTCRIRASTLHDAAMLTCFSNDYDYKTAFSRMLTICWRPTDILVVISSSGESENILNAALFARSVSGTVISFTGFTRNNALLQASSLGFWVPSKAYGTVESAHAHLIHMNIDLYQQSLKGRLTNLSDSVHEELA